MLLFFFFFSSLFLAPMPLASRTRRAVEQSQPHVRHSRSGVKEEAAGAAPYLVLLLVLQDSLEEGSALVARGFLVKHAGLDNLLINIQLVFGGGEDLLLHAVDGAEPEDAHFVLLPDAVRAVLRLQVLPGKRVSFAEGLTAGSRRDRNTLLSS